LVIDKKNQLEIKVSERTRQLNKINIELEKTLSTINEQNSFLAIQKKYKTHYYQIKI
tara:strand:- start:259 stop:429 length:171 start_codon:yes stop_codon:yes gene_type:complete